MALKENYTPSDTATNDDVNIWTAQINKNTTDILAKTNKAGDTMTGALHLPNPVTKTSSGGVLTLDETSNSFLANGSEAITSITGFSQKGFAFIRWNTARTLTHNALSLILIGGVNRTTAQGDIGLYEFTAAGVRELTFFPISGAPISIVPVLKGGTGLASYAQGDLLYASDATTLTKLAKGTAGQVLIMNDGATAPSWATILKACRVTRSADKSVGSGDVAIDWDTETFKDIAGIHSNSVNNSQLIIPAGWSRAKLTGNLYSNVGGGGTLTLKIRKNGNIFIAIATSVEDDNLVGLNISSGEIAVSPGDYFELVHYNHSGSHTMYKDYSWFCLELIK